MLSSPQVTVICICYNHENYVVDALNSVINQTYKNIQLIIIDDYSTDNSKGIIDSWIKKHSNISFLANSENLGSIKTFNKAYKQATGDYIIDLAADDILLEDCIDEQIKAFENSKLENLAIVYGNIELVDDKKTFISIYYDEKDNPSSGDIYKMVIGRTTKICSTASMVKRSVFDSIGGYDQNLAYEDLDLWVRVSRHHNFEYIPKILAQKRELSDSLSSQFFIKGKSTKRLHISTLKILNKILQLNTSKEEYKIMLKRIKFEFFKFWKAKEYILILRLLFIALKAQIKGILFK